MRFAASRSVSDLPWCASAIRFLILFFFFPGLTFPALRSENNLLFHEVPPLPDQGFFIALTSEWGT